MGVVVFLTHPTIHGWCGSRHNCHRSSGRGRPRCFGRLPLTFYSPPGAFFYIKKQSFKRLFLCEVRAGIEPAHRGFADLCLTAWLPYRDNVTRQYHYWRTFSRCWQDSSLCLQWRCYFTYPSGLTRTPFFCTSKCKWIPVTPRTLPVLPIKPIVWPVST